MFLFARPSPPPKQRRGFLALPPELRNRIYHYYFQEGFRAEIAAPAVVLDHLKPKTFKLCLPIQDKNGSIYKYVPNATVSRPQTLRMSRSLGHYKRVNGISTNWTTSLCPLILVCKLLYNETIPLLYLNTTFILESSNRLSNLIATVPNINLSFITNLQLHYASYGHPTFTDHTKFQEKHIASWNRACKAASKSLTNLQDLTIWVQANAHMIFSLRAPYLQPLLQFRRLCLPKNSNPKSSLSITSNNKTTEEEKRLRNVTVYFETYQIRRNAWRSEITEAVLELQELFGKAIARAILGWKEEDAMREVWEARERGEEEWGEHLRVLDYAF